MKSQQLIAYILIALGVMALLARFTGGAGWLWVTLVAAALLWGYTIQKNYGLLVAGSIVMGVAIGLLLENNWGWNGAFLVSLGIGFIMIDRIETRQNRWPFYVGAMIAAFGVIAGLLASGFLGSFWFALLLIVAGAFLLSRDKQDNWVKVEPNSYQPSQGNMSQAQASTVSNLEGSIQDVSASPYKTFSSTEVAAPAATSEEAPHSPLTHEVDQNLYSKLEEWRRETAKSEDRAAYLILTNETLQHIASLKPQTLDELRSIKGIGEVKLERYGQTLLEILKETY